MKCQTYPAMRHYFDRCVLEGECSSFEEFALNVHSSRSARKLQTDLNQDLSNRDHPKWPKPLRFSEKYVKVCISSGVNFSLANNPQSALSGLSVWNFGWTWPEVTRQGSKECRMCIWVTSDLFEVACRVILPPHAWYRIARVNDTSQVVKRDGNARWLSQITELTKDEKEQLTLKVFSQLFI